LTGNVPTGFRFARGIIWLRTPAAGRRGEAARGFHATYRWDFLKVMFDYRLSYPAAVDDADNIDLPLMLAQADWSAPFRRQREVLVHLCDAMGSDVPIVETVYSPWMYLVRHLGREFLSQAQHHGHELVQILDRLTNETCLHVRELKRIGCHGIYFATLAADQALCGSLVDDAYDLDVLGEAAGLVRMLHLHGTSLDAAAVKRHPRDVLHWEDRDPSNPTLSQLRADNGCLMGGLSSSLTTMSMSAFRHQVADAIAEAGPNGLMIAPGCSVSPSLSSRKMMALRDLTLVCS
jgi:uroporphyrinogen decarboxylase